MNSERSRTLFYLVLWLKSKLYCYFHSIFEMKLVTLKDEWMLLIFWVLCLKLSYTFRPFSLSFLFFFLREVRIAYFYSTNIAMTEISNIMSMHLSSLELPMDTAGYLWSLACIPNTSCDLQNPNENLYV